MSQRGGTATLRADAATTTRVVPLAVAAVCWGALAVGGAYPWAYWPLAAVSLVAGGAGILAYRGVQGLTTSLTLALGASGVAMLLQLVPLPLGWLEAVSPHAARILADTDFSYGAGLLRSHPASVEPVATASALGLYVSFAVLLVGLTRALAVDSARRIVEALTIFGVLMALIGIVQKPVYAGRVLGIWEPEYASVPFGPFVNRNHFAGWMLMVLPLTLALLCAGIEHGMRGVRSGLRYKILWLSSPEASRLILLAAGAAVMAMSLVLTMSRSGISALALSLVLTGWVVARGLKGRARRTAGAAYLLLLLITAVGWVGADAIVARFSETNWAAFNNRRGAWADAVRVASLYPLTGTGVNTYETVARFQQRHDLARFYGESHNDYLELVAEGGLLVGLPALACAFLLVREIRRRMRDDPPTTLWWLRRGAVTGLIGIAFQEIVEFSLQMPGNAVVFVVLCAIALHRPQQVRQSAPRPEPATARSRLRVITSSALRPEGAR